MTQGRPGAKSREGLVLPDKMITELKILLYCPPGIGKFRASRALFDSINHSINVVAKNLHHLLRQPSLPRSLDSGKNEQNENGL